MTLSQQGVSARRAICEAFTRPTRRYVVNWRHRVLDTPDYPFRGGGFAYGKSEHAALNAYFCPTVLPGGDRSHLGEMAAAWRRGDIEVRKVMLG